MHIRDLESILLPIVPWQPYYYKSKAPPGEYISVTHLFSSTSGVLLATTLIYTSCFIHEVDMEPHIIHPTTRLHTSEPVCDCACLLQMRIAILHAYHEY